MLALNVPQWHKKSLSCRKLARATQALIYLPKVGAGVTIQQIPHIPALIVLNSQIEFCFTRLRAISRSHLVNNSSHQRPGRADTQNPDAQPE